ncbi:MAG: type II secretion system protein GspC [Pseudomonadota bacterium]
MRGGIRQYYWVIDLVGIFLCAFFLAKLTSVYLGKAMEVKRSVAVLKTSELAAEELSRPSLTEYSVILDRDIFDSTPPAEKGESVEEESEAAEKRAKAGEAVLTNLNVQVMGVLVVGDGKDKRSTATIVSSGASPTAPTKGAKGAAASSGAAVYAVGDEESFAPNTELVRIQPDRIEFLHSGRLEYAEVLSEEGLNIFAPPAREPLAMVPSTEEPAGKETMIRPEGAGRFTVDKREVEDAIQNLDRLYTEIRAVPNFAGGKVSGMKILSVKGGSLFAKLGLRRGDVLQKINGMELDVKRGFEIFNTLKEESSITLDLIRQGQPTTLEYEIR